MAEELKKICLVSLGCPKNLVDSELMLGSLQKEGFSFSIDPSGADVIVVNTCGFLEASSRESIGKVLELARYKKEGSCRLLVATGCLTQRYGARLAKELPEVDLFLGTGEFDRLAGILRDRFCRGEVTSPLHDRTLVTPRQILPDPDLPRVLSTPHHYAYVKISEGCSHICSFCTIPSIRGGLKSRPLDSIVREVRELVEKGVKEFNLIAQDLNEYGRDLKTGLAGLIRELDRIEGDFWIRPLYMYPLEFTDSLIDVLGGSEHVVKYVDMPLQHISEKILLSMKRGSPSRYVRQLLSKLKTRIPGVALRTTFIVGYPGETEVEFEELCRFVSEYEFDRVGVFRFSEEEGTAAADLPGQVAAEIREERYHRLMSLQQAISLKKNRGLVGSVQRVLCDRLPNGSRFFEGRLSTQAPEIDGVTHFSGPGISAGEFTDVQIVGATEYDLTAVTREMDPPGGPQP